jgi:hypothetical protein
MPVLDVLQEMQAYLIAQGIGVAPFTPAPAAGVETVSIWLDPRDGAPLPRNIVQVAGVLKGEIIVSLTDTTRRSPSALEPWMSETFIDVTVRSPQQFPGMLVQRSIRDLLMPNDAVGGRWQWMMGALLVENSIEWRGDQPLPHRQALGAADPHLTYDRSAGYRISCRRKVLAGLSLP